MTTIRTWLCRGSCCASPTRAQELRAAPASRRTREPDAAGARRSTARSASIRPARRRAAWLELIGKGIDPKIEEARQKAEAQRRQVNTFAAVAADFLERHAAKLAKSTGIERIIDAEFVKRWGARPATEIMPEEVATAIRAIVKRGAPYQAHNAFALSAAAVPVGDRHRRVRHPGIADRTAAARRS